jgi:hypothetical protein
MIHIKEVLGMFSIPRVAINLMHEKTADNDPFYDRAVMHFYNEAKALHPKLLFAARKYEYGYALCPVPNRFDDYFMNIEASARRNYKKSVKLGYQFKRFHYNNYLDDVRRIWLSTPVRQGLMPQEMREGRVQANTDPPSRSPYQDYPIYGVFRDNTLYAYGACLVTGELCSLNEVFGHARTMEDGIVPRLIIDIMRELISSYPTVKYYGYDTYFGASDSLRRFKRKFLFAPHRVSWVLGTAKETATC